MPAYATKDFSTFLLGFSEILAKIDLQYLNNHGGATCFYPFVSYYNQHLNAL